MISINPSGTRHDKNPRKRQFSSLFFSLFPCHPAVPDQGRGSPPDDHIQFPARISMTCTRLGGLSPSSPSRVIAWGEIERYISVNVYCSFIFFYSVVVRSMSRVIFFFGRFVFIVSFVFTIVKCHVVSRFGFSPYTCLHVFLTANVDKILS